MPNPIIKDKGMAFGREIARSKRNEKQNLIREIKNLESVLSNHPNDEESIKKLSTLKTSFELFEINEAEGARIRSGQKWAQDGEKFTKYFLNLEKHRSNCNTLFSVIKNSDPSSSVSDPLEILDEIKYHFSKIYSSSESDSVDDSLNKIFAPEEGLNIFDVNDETILEGIISEDEVLNALKQSNNSSSPGLDGLPCEIYKVFWHKIKKTSS